MAKRISATRRTRLEQRRARYETELEELHDLLDAMTESDVNNYTIGSRNISRYKNIPDVLAAIDKLEKKLDEIDAEIEGGHRRKAVAVIPRDV